MLYTIRQLICTFEIFVYTTHNGNISARDLNCYELLLTTQLNFVFYFPKRLRECYNISDCMCQYVAKQVFV